MRNSLVMQFRCSECGGNVSLDYEGTENYAKFAITGSDDGITGASKVHQYVTVHPCEHCYNKAKAPILMMKEAINAIKDI